MDLQPLVSVALCTYNGVNHLTEQLQSILNQSFRNLEVVVVDDKSSDGTVELVHAYMKEFPNRIKFYQNNTNLGFNKNFEKALSLCSGDLIAISDQDDIWMPDKISLQVKNLKNNLLIYHDSLMVNENGESLDIKISSLRNMYQGDNPNVFIFNNCVSGHSILMKRELLKYLFPFPKMLYYDWWIAYQATQFGSLNYIDKCLVHYRQHDNTITGSNLTTKSNKSVASKVEVIVNSLSQTENRKNKGLLIKLDQLFGSRNRKLLNFELFLLFYKNRREFLYISKKNNLSKLNRVFKNLYSKNTHV